jgi:hypothetical protein
MNSCHRGSRLRLSAIFPYFAKMPDSPAGFRHDNFARSDRTGFTPVPITEYCGIFHVQSWQETAEQITKACTAWHACGNVL